MPSKFIGVLCFIFNSRHGMLLLCLRALREEESRASNEATVVLVVTQPVPELGEDLGRILQHLCTHPCVTCIILPPLPHPGPKLLKTKMCAFEVEASSPTGAGYVPGGFSVLVVSALVGVCPGSAQHQTTLQVWGAPALL